MAFNPKAWQNSPSTATPIDAPALIELEQRLAAYADAPVAVNAGNVTGAINVDLNSLGSQVYRATLTNDVAITFSEVGAGSRWFMELRQDGVGGRKATWAGVTWIPYGPPALSTTANDIDLFEFISLDGSTIYGFPITGASQPPGQFGISTRLENMPRLMASTVVGLASAFVFWTHFPRLDRDFVVSNILTVNRGTIAAGGTFTRTAVGVVSGTNQDTVAIRGRSRNDLPTRWNANGLDTAPIVDDGSSATTNVTLRAGEIPAVGVLFVGTTAPQLEGSPKHATESALLPRLASTSTGSQSDVSGSYATMPATGSVFWAGLT